MDLSEEQREEFKKVHKKRCEQIGGPRAFKKAFFMAFASIVLISLIFKTWISTL